MKVKRGGIAEDDAEFLLFSSTVFLTQAEAADLLRLSGRTLERHRVAGTGPTFVKLGRRVVYRARDLALWAEAHAHRSTSEFVSG